jgi:hypothetical protein
MMAGTISIDDRRRWTAASWLFDFALRTIAEHASDAELSGELVGIIGENLGWLSLADLTGQQREEFERVVSFALVPSAEVGLPPELMGREDAIEMLKDLAAMVHD